MDNDSNELPVSTTDDTPSATDINIPSHSIQLHFEPLTDGKQNSSSNNNDKVPETIILNNLLNIKLTGSSEPTQVDLRYVDISESFIWTVKQLQLEMDSEAANKLCLILTQYLSKLKHRPRHLLAFVNPQCGQGEKC
jgi:hypothetical protein